MPKTETDSMSRILRAGRDEDEYVSRWLILSRGGGYECVVLGNYSPSGHQASRVVSPLGVSPTVMENHGTVTATIVRNMEDKRKATAFDEQNGYERTDGTVGTLTTDGSSPKHNNRVIDETYRIRKLTPRECWRLMGFDDRDYDSRRKVNSRTQLYKQAGNSIIVQVLEAIFKQLTDKAERDDSEISFFPKNYFEFTKPIRLIELFRGIGSQAKRMQRLGLDFEAYRVIEWDKFCIRSYNEMFGTNFTTQDIKAVKGEDLGIVDTDKYDYVVTYSFPCQDLSVRGKGAGMSKGSGTRSGLLWEVERLLNETEHLPVLLLMENVPQVHGKGNEADFKAWQDFLRSKGYSNFWKDLNGKDYGIPQNRNRCFMVSILGDYDYDFPSPQKLELCLGDMLEDEVDEYYFLDESQIEGIINQKYKFGTWGYRVADRGGTTRSLTRHDAFDPRCVDLGESDEG